MQSHIFDAAHSLKRQFEEASTRWPNLESVLVLWPEGETYPPIPPSLGPQSGVPAEVKNSSGQRVVVFRSIYDTALDNEAHRFRAGFAGSITFWRRFGQFDVHESLIADPATECAAAQRFDVLSEAGVRLIDDVKGGGLSRETLFWQQHHMTGWPLAVHELMRPPRRKLDGNAPESTAVYERIQDLFLASANAISRLLSMEAEPPPSNTAKSGAKRRRKRKRAKARTAHRDLEWAKEFARDGWVNVSEFAIEKKKDRTTMSKALVRGRVLLELESVNSSR